MSTPLENKSSNDEIRARFDADVERFSSLNTGQQTTIDAVLSMELITQAAVHATSPIERVLDVGCGAGNNSLKLLAAVTNPAFDQSSKHTGRPFEATLLDLSSAMLQRAEQRLRDAAVSQIQTLNADFREAELADNHYDVVLAAAVLHHLRDEQDWRGAFEKLYRILRPGGSVWITDLVWHEHPALQEMMWQRYGDYLCGLQDASFRDAVFEYIDREDSPRPVSYQLELLRSVGFTRVDVLHKNSCFAAFGAVK